MTRVRRTETLGGTLFTFSNGMRQRHGPAVSFVPFHDGEAIIAHARTEYEYEVHVNDRRAPVFSDTLLIPAPFHQTGSSSPPLSSSRVPKSRPSRRRRRRRAGLDSEAPHTPLGAESRPRGVERGYCVCPCEEKGRGDRTLRPCAGRL